MAERLTTCRSLTGSPDRAHSHNAGSDPEWQRIPDGTGQGMHFMAHSLIVTDPWNGVGDAK
jgi:hypothetical protein